MQLARSEVVASAACAAMMDHLQPRALAAYGTLGRALGWIPLAATREVGAFFAGMVRVVGVSTTREKS